MGKLIITAAIVASAAFATPSIATIIQVDPSSIQGANVLFNQGTQTGTTVFGNTNLGANTVAFTGTTLGGGNTISANGGQARVEGALNTVTSNPNDTLLMTSLQFGLTNMATFNNLEFNVFGGTATSVTFNITDNEGQLFTFANLALGNGENFFGFQGINNETIRTVSATLNGGGVQDFRQIRLDGFAATSAVPEPTTWAMMLVGFGAVGYSMRKRPSRKTQLA
jgi:hypothetical protein